MRRGTTPTLVFTMPYAASQVESGYVTFAQRGISFLDKNIRDEAVEVDDMQIKVYLDQEDTLLMTEVAKLKIQIRLKLVSGKAVASQVMECDVGEILKDGVI